MLPTEMLLMTTNSNQ